MKVDAETYHPYQSYFTMSVLDCVYTKADADRLEVLLIATYAAQGPGGYNNLPGNPGRSAKFWFLRNKHIAII